MRNIKTYYLARKLYLRGFRLLPKLFGRLSRLLYSCEIAYTADIHESVVFPHKGLGVVIGHNVTIGKNSKILQHVTVGGRSGISKNPLIGQNVLIGAGAILL